LLATASLDAAKHYAAAASDAKAAGDPLWQAGCLLGLAAAAYDAVVGRHASRPGRAAQLVPPGWDRAAWEALAAAADAAAASVLAEPGDGDRGSSDSTGDGGAADHPGNPPPPPPPVNGSPAQATRVALTRTRSEVEGGAVEVEGSAREDALPKCLEELAKVLPEFRDCLAPPSSSAAGPFARFGLSKGGSGKEAALSGAAKVAAAAVRAAAARKEVDALLRAVAAACGEAARVLEPLATGSSSTGGGQPESPPSPAAAALLAEVRKSVCACFFRAEDRCGNPWTFFS
jgi:hypothetical protein